MEIEDGVIWVYGVGEDGVIAFTDFGIENLIDLIKMYKEDPTLLKRSDHDKKEACGLRRMDTYETALWRQLGGLLLMIEATQTRRWPRTKLFTYR